MISDIKEQRQTPEKEDELIEVKEEIYNQLLEADELDLGLNKKIGRSKIGVLMIKTAPRKRKIRNRRDAYKIFLRDDR
jgi:hypothetical protein